MGRSAGEFRKDSPSRARLGIAKSAMRPHYPHDRCTPCGDLICIRSRAHRSEAFPTLPPPAHRSGASGSMVRPHSPANASSQRRAPVQSCRGHITRQRGPSRSFVQANDMPKRNLGRDPREIRFAGVVMTNGMLLALRGSRVR